MPSKAENTEKIDLDVRDSEAILKAYVFVLRQKAGKKAYWYLRINLRQNKQLVLSTKIEYKGGKDKLDALKIAQKLLEEKAKRLRLDLPLREKTVSGYVTELLKEAKAGYELNEDLPEPRVRTIFDNGFWTRRYYLQLLSYYETIILPFFDKGDFKNKPLVKLTQNDIYRWEAWRNKNLPIKAPSTISKQNTALRSLFKLAMIRGENFIAPAIPEPKKELRERRRPEFNDHQYLQLLSHLRDSFKSDFQSSKKKKSLKSEQHLILYCYLETLEHSGVRSGVGANPIRMSDIRKTKSKTGEPVFLIDRKEKGISYTAAASRYWIKTLDRLNRFYAAKGMSNREYMFAHWRDIPSANVKKGDAIKSFKTAFATAMKNLGFNDDAIERGENNKKLSFYSIRHRAIGRRLRESGSNIVEVCEAFGTSIEMATKIYHHYNIEKNYEKLMEGTIDYDKNVDVFNRFGYWVDSIAANGVAHRNLYKVNPKLVGFAPE